MHRVLNKLSEYTYFYTLKNITSYTFLLVFKIVESLQCILNSATPICYSHRTLSNPLPIHIKLCQTELPSPPNSAKPNCHLPILKFTLTYEFRPYPKHTKTRTYKHHKTTTLPQAHKVTHAKTNKGCSYCFPSGLETTSSFISYNFNKTKDLTFLNFRFIMNFKK